MNTESLRERLRGLSFDGRYLRLGGRAIADMRYANNRENAEAIVALAAKPAEGLDVGRLAAWLHELDGTQHYVRHEPADGYGSDEPTEVIECVTGVAGHMEDAMDLLARLREGSAK